MKTCADRPKIQIVYLENILFSYPAIAKYVFRITRDYLIITIIIIHMPLELENNNTK